MLGKSLKRRTSTTESEQMDQLVAALEQAAALAQAGVPTQQVWEQLETCQQLNHGVWGSASKAARQLVEQAGASASDLLNDLAVTAMQYQEAADSRNAALAGPQATARTLAWLPLVGLGLGALLGAQPWQVLTDAGIGSLAGLVGLGLLLIGRWWTRQMIRKATFAVPVDDVLAVDLCAAALRAGLALPAALEAAGRASGGALAQYLAASGRQLAQGHSWQQAWANYPPEQAEIVQQVRQVLRLAWCHGAAGAPLLIGLTARLRRRAKRQAIQAAGRLSVTLMLPLGLCYLPAFVALGLIPVVLSLASGLWLAS